MQREKIGRFLLGYRRRRSHHKQKNLDQVIRPSEWSHALLYLIRPPRLRLQSIIICQKITSVLSLIAHQSQKFERHLNPSIIHPRRTLPHQQTRHIINIRFESILATRCFNPNGPHQKRAGCQHRSQRKRRQARRQHRTISHLHGCQRLCR